MARAPALHAGGQGFDSLILHKGTERIIRDIGSSLRESIYCHASQKGTESSLTLLRNEKEAVTVFAKGAVMGEKVRKSKWGMPRLSKATKDVVSCEKLRGLANTS